MPFPRQTPVEDVPLAIAPFQGRVLVGVGKLLRIYDMGKKKLLRKCENKVSVCVCVPRGKTGSSENGLCGLEDTFPGVQATRKTGCWPVGS